MGVWGRRGAIGVSGGGGGEGGGCRRVCVWTGVLGWAHWVVGGDAPFLSTDGVNSTGGFLMPPLGEGWVREYLFEIGSFHFWRWEINFRTRCACFCGNKYCFIAIVSARRKNLFARVPREEIICDVVGHRLDTRVSPVRDIPPHQCFARDGRKTFSLRSCAVLSTCGCEAM